MIIVITIAVIVLSGLALWAIQRSGGGPGKGPRK